jgi:hypothetical protein
MKRAALRLLCLVVCLLLALVFGYFAAPSLPVVVEKEMRAELSRDAVTITTPIHLRSVHINAKLILELLDSENNIVAGASKTLTLQQGETLVGLRLPWEAFAEEDDWQERFEMLSWARVRYRLITEETDHSMSHEVEGVRSLAWMLKGLFGLRIVAPNEPAQGKPAWIRIFAENPLTGKPVPGVRIEASLRLEEGDEAKTHPVVKRGVTDKDGSLAFELTPPGVPDHDRDEEIECELKVVGLLGMVQVEKEQDIDFYSRAQAILTTDKPLYQPGQILHLRTLVYDSYSRRPRQNEDLEVEIEDEAYKTVFERKLTTDRFGVASTDWQIPATAPLGQYRISVARADHYSMESTNVRISRYELPTFVVQVEPDRSFYLPSQNALVKVTGRFVYGEPVKAGRVRLAREESREWNFKEQKWDVEEGHTWEGETDADGAFAVTIPLAEEHEKFTASDYGRYKDIEYAARFSERSSARSEERRFRLRLTKEAIHVYVFSTETRQTGNLPLRIYAVANYADGAPAMSELAISAYHKVTKPFEKSNPIFTSQARTDQHGIALIESSVNLDNPQELQLKIQARDAKGATGAASEELPISEGEALRLQTNRSLYHQNESLEVEIQSSIQEIPRLIVELFAEDRIIRSETVTVRDGRASVTFPKGSDLQGRLTIVAYDPEEDSPYIWQAKRFASRTVLYPVRRTLAIDARFERDLLKPGEGARAIFNSKAPDGAGRETSLGVVVYDTAVEERERTECESMQGRDYFGRLTSRFFNWHEGLSDVSLATLEQLDEKKPFPADLELIADALLQRVSSHYGIRSFAARIESADVRSEFRDLVEPLNDTIAHILTGQSPSSYPRDANQLFALLSRHGVPLDRMTDFWGNPYRTHFDLRGAAYTIAITSDGPDEQTGTRDDINLIDHSRNFFEERYAQEITTAIDALKGRRGHFPISLNEVLEELRFRSASFLQAKDPWGRPFELRYGGSRYRSFYELRVVSSGKDGHFNKTRHGDDVQLFALDRDWFADAREAIRQALNSHFAATQEYPANEEEFVALLNYWKIDYRKLSDPWGQPLRVNFTEISRYATRTRIEKIAATPNAPAVDKTILEPVTNHIRQIQIYVATKPSLTTFFNGVKEPVSFSIAYYDQVVNVESRDDALKEKNGSQDDEQTSGPRQATPQQKKIVPTGLAGAVTGVVKDLNGAAVSNAKVTLTNSTTRAVVTTTTDETGNYWLTILSPGNYSLRVDAQGFKSFTIESLEVRLSATTVVDAQLEVGSVSETVTITAGNALMVQKDSSSVANVRKEPVNTLSLPQRANQASTPRLRQDFPETLVWQPQLVTDARGRGEIKFTVADSITTWRMAVVGSTVDGLIGTATADLRAFQPFFVEHQPPPSLTIGDEIETPVVIRNYQERAASVKVKLAPAPWMQIIGGADQTLSAGAKDSATARIAFKAIAAGSFKQEASAIGKEDGDRISRPVQVRYDGRDIWQTRADLFQRETTLDVTVPNDAIADSTDVELKLYPDLFAHALEGIEGITRRPYGCAEQTTSAGYTNLIVLQYLKRTGRKMPELEKVATRNLEEALARLHSFATSNGGYSYFGGANPDVAVTAYILRFFLEASEFVVVDPEILSSMRRYLAHEQRADGAWVWAGYSALEKSAEKTANLTGLVARALTMSQPSSVATNQSADDPQQAIAKGLTFLARATRERDNAYTLALYVIACQRAGQAEAAREAARELLRLGQEEAGALFWDVSDGTPFYGWGRAGRLETTGLVVEALMTISRDQPAMKGDEREELERTACRGLLFVVQNKDEYGVWYSTQATVNVLRAIIAVSTGEDLEPKTTRVMVSVDGSAPRMLDVGFNAGGPSLFDLKAFFPQSFASQGRHRIVLRAASSRNLSAAVVAHSAVMWNQKDARGISDNGGLRLRVGYDKTELKSGETVVCSVHAERVASAGYGMMMAEIGLPPGVDVDAESLRRQPLMKYDITPDRVVFYLWPQAGGTDFSFTFRPRLKINALAQPSLLYDYYNPDARVAIPPARFRVDRPNQ